MSIGPRPKPPLHLTVTCIGCHSVMTLGDWQNPRFHAVGGCPVFAPIKGIRPTLFKETRS